MMERRPHLSIRSITEARISAEELRCVFQQFYSSDKLRPSEKRGMGMGLTICREIIWLAEEECSGTFAQEELFSPSLQMRTRLP